MKNIAANPEVAVHLESGDEVVILEGRATAMAAPPPRELTERLSGAYTAKYAAHDYAPKPDQWDGGGLYVVTLATWVLMLLWSKAWLAHFRFGPLEWLWRCLTYGRMFALRR